MKSETEKTKMAKEKNPYQQEQHVLEITPKGLQSLEETQLKELRDEINAKYIEVRKKRIDATKEWVNVYYNTREKTIELNNQIKSGRMNSKEAVKQLRDFVNSTKATAELD